LHKLGLPQSAKSGHRRSEPLRVQISTGNIASDGEMDCLYRERYSRLMGQDEAYPITSKSQ